MSLEKTEMITCPNCGKASEFAIWQSLNSTLDPEAKQRLMSGKLFSFKCHIVSRFVMLIMAFYLWYLSPNVLELKEIEYSWKFCNYCSNITYIKSLQVIRKQTNLACC